MTLGFPVPIHKSIQTDLVLHLGRRRSLEYVSLAAQATTTRRPDPQLGWRGAPPEGTYDAVQMGGFKRAILQRTTYFRYHIEKKLCERTKGGWVGVTYMARDSWSEGCISSKRRRSEYRDSILIRARNIVNSRTRCEQKMIKK